MKKLFAIAGFVSLVLIGFDYSSYMRAEVIGETQPQEVLQGFTPRLTTSPKKYQLNQEFHLAAIVELDQIKTVLDLIPQQYRNALKGIFLLILSVSFLAYAIVMRR